MFEKVQKIADPDTIKKELPLSEKAVGVKAECDKKIQDVFLGISDKFLLIIGPCSAHNFDAVYEYTSRLAKVQDKVKDKLVIIPRVYTNKPRTTGAGYKGMAHQPDPTEAPDIAQGLKTIRRMHIKMIEDFGFSTADEMLYPGNHPYLSDVLGYVAVGARSVEDQLHRLTASGVDMPVGMKNPTSGDLTVMLNSIQAAQMKHSFLYNGWEVKTDGNEYAHAVLRGAVNKHGENIPNYHYEDLMLLNDTYIERQLANPSIIIDTNHANSGKRFYEQPRIAMEVMQSRKRADRLRKLVKGLMIESYLVEGTQSVDGTTFGQSITDACLGWEASERLILDIADAI
ncbi:MAG: 3-deoxy-7-phosphoheptulonate synthase [Candidatus Omnitrophica bacterium]|nr:3-deoxy-7-phosphoheptulonate synthase [Candidatus Omnitrophota bacterium]MDD5080687.1 3-deoxy-7-phosphoheptulonate synthase [Candidatus Omnitrophota bacterium]MDD5440655.1 3-deoxy-7-phosphoheptulonate synthase [Candidatus Omnitrophota bacterium]